MNVLLISMICLFSDWSMIICGSCEESGTAVLDRFLKSSCHRYKRPTDVCRQKVILLCLCNCMIKKIYVVVAEGKEDIYIYIIRLSYIHILLVWLCHSWQQTVCLYLVSWSKCKWYSAVTVSSWLVPFVPMIHYTLVYCDSHINFFV